jgi:hypothetical protein
MAREAHYGVPTTFRRSPIRSRTGRVRTPNLCGTPHWLVRSTNEQRLSGTNTMANTRSWLVQAARYEPTVKRDAAGRLVVDRSRIEFGDPDD